VANRRPEKASPPELSQEVIQVMQDLNPWWLTGRLRKAAPAYHRRGVPELLNRITRSKGLIEIIRGPRQVGKTTAIEQIVARLLSTKTPPSDVLFVRFDQEVLRESLGGLLGIVRWYEQSVRRRPFEKGAQSYIFLDEVHKLPRWDEDVKHLFDTFPVRVMLTGSSSVLVSKGGRESLAGRTNMTDFPTFQFREVLEAWLPVAQHLDPPRSFGDLFTISSPRDFFFGVQHLSQRHRTTLRQSLERYYNRGGYPRLYNGEVLDDEWADYLTATIMDRVLGVDIPDLFPVRNPQLLRWLYVEVARSTGQEIIQNRVAEFAEVYGFKTSQPHIGNYLHYLADALLIREFRRYPTAKRKAARTPAKITLTDLGARNAIFRGAPSLWESDPQHVGPLIETLAQSVMQGHGIQVHFFREHENPKNRNSPLVEVDFVAEDQTGAVVPIEIKFRHQLHGKDFFGLRNFMKRFKTPYGVLVTRDTFDWKEEDRILCVPLLDFLCTF
jgi:predicted AAA+ superfamily ATPase